MEIRTFEDILEALRKNPKWKEELRKIILTEELLNLPQLVKEIMTELKEISQIVRELTISVKKQSERIDKLTTRVENLEKFQAELEKSHIELRKSHEELSKTVQELIKSHEELSKTVQELIKSHVEIRERIERLEKSHSELEKSHIELRKSHEELSKTVQELIKSHVELKKSHEELSKTVQELTKTVSNLVNEVSSLTKEVRDIVNWQKGESARRRGEIYEERMVKNALLIFKGGKGGSTDNPIIVEKLSEWLGKIFKEGRDIGEEESPTLSDIIWLKNGRVGVCEVSITVGMEDIIRAIKRAKTLRDCGVDAYPIVIGDGWEKEEFKEYAEMKGVLYVIKNKPSKSFEEIFL